MKICLIRHGKTAGNLESRYVGRTDEPLCAQGRSELEALPLKAKKCMTWAVDGLYVSPMLRCRQTAKILFPGCRQILVEDFRECDFGRFEYKNYRQLSDSLEYQAWIDSNGTLPFPGGESREHFQERSVKAFLGVLEDAKSRDWDTVACVVHGGTIMSVMEALARPCRSYFDYQVKNGGGYVCVWDGNRPYVLEHTIAFGPSA